jgi:hypothetical protein
MQCLTPCLAFPTPPPPGESHTKSSHMVLDCCDSSFSPGQKKIRQKAELCQTKPQPAISLIRGSQWILQKIYDVAASEVRAFARFATFNNMPALWEPSNQLFSQENPRFSEILFLRILFYLLSSIAAGIGIPASSISVRYRSIPVPDWGTLIPVPDNPAFRHLTKLHKGTSTVGSSVRL